MLLTCSDSHPDSLSASPLQRGKTFTVKDTSVNDLTIHNGKVATLTTIVQNHTGAGPSYALNEIERNNSVDTIWRKFK